MKLLIPLTLAGAAYSLSNGASNRRRRLFSKNKVSLGGAICDGCTLDICSTVKKVDAYTNDINKRYDAVQLFLSKNKPKQGPPGLDGKPGYSGPKGTVGLMGFAWPRWFTRTGRATRLTRCHGKIRNRGC